MANPARIRQAREYAGLTQDKLAEQIDVTQPAIAQVERGYQPGSAELLQKIAQATAFPLQFFDQGNPPEISKGSLLFRAHRSTTGHKNRQVLQHAAINLELFEYLRRRAGDIRPRLRLRTADLSPAGAAREARKMLCVFKGPIGVSFRQSCVKPVADSW